LENLLDFKNIDEDIKFPIIAIELLSKKIKKLKDVYLRLRLGYTIENLHDTRVNLRRLEALLEAFSGYLLRDEMLLNENYKYLSEIKKMVKVLSKPRSYDVSFETINSYSETIPYDISMNLLSCGIRMKKVNALDNMYRSETFWDFKKIIKNLNKFVLEDIPKNITESISSPTFEKVYIEIIQKYYNSCITKADINFFPSDMIKYIHSYRISLKPLKYLIEIGEEYFGNGFILLANKIKSLVELLGEFNDIHLTFDLSENIITNESLKSMAYIKYLFYLKERMHTIYDEICIELKSLKQNNYKEIFS